MLFDDMFYPGNPQRRQEVFTLQGQIRANFILFKNSWNDCVAILNPLLAVNHPDLQLTTLTCDLDRDCVGDCITMFNAAVTDAQPKFAKLLDDIGLTAGVPGLPPGSIDVDPEAIHKINQFITGSADGAVSIFAIWYVYNSIRLFTLVLNYAGAAVSEVASMIAGALGGMIVGAVGFVITDVIASAIAGAVERKQLNEAIDALREFRDRVADPLLKAAGKLAGITQALKDNVYMVSDNIVVGLKGGVYKVWQLTSGAFPGIIYFITNRNLYWYQDLSQDSNSGTYDIGTGKIIGRGSWDTFKNVFADEAGNIYAVTLDGNLLRYRDAHRDGTGDIRGAVTAGRQRWADFKFLFAGGSGILYAVTRSGDLLWYRDQFQSNSDSITGGNVIGYRGWADFAFVFNGGGGIIYAVKQDGSLSWYRDKTRDGTGDIGTGVQIADSGWSDLSTAFGDSTGRLYAINRAGNLLVGKDRNRNGTGRVVPAQTIGFGSWTSLAFSGA